jgi:hypothetical protein
MHFLFRRPSVALGDFMHKRSELQRQKRNIRRTIFASSFRDKILHETICRLSRDEVLGLLREPVQVSLVPDVEKVEVLIDLRGRGTFQKVQ